MKKIAYYSLFCSIKCLSLLPFRELYIIADGLYFFIFYIAGYRKKVVIENLKNSFPEKSQTEINRIAKEYYRYMADLLLESFKSLSMSKKKYMERVTYPNIEILQQYTAKQQNFILVTGHHGNWEWVAVSIPLVMDALPVIVYKPMSNTGFDKIFCDIRTKFGSKIVPMKHTFRAMIENKGVLNATMLNADQSPGVDNSLWVNFMGRETAFFNGAEKLAIKFGYPVIYFSISKIKRGRYEVRFESLCEDPGNTGEGEITQAFASKLEKEIRKQPETWLWSHRRWKHVKPQKVSV